ncbi:hypothetical protein [Pseudomonas citronellolis]|uniref:hypothetical protein n=1 Tax=Pseudomonas citronellolis TaxID=53408 RepID=UPI000B1A65D3|nr:hypothetical protein [Pseudomonas citronellolis]
MSAKDEQLFKACLDALERVLRIFQIERIVYLALTILSFLLLIYAIYLTFSEREISTQTLIAFYGSGGLITISSARITFFFNRAFNIVEDLIKVVATGIQKPPPTRKTRNGNSGA